MNGSLILSWYLRVFLRYFRRLFFFRQDRVNPRIIVALSTILTVYVLLLLPIERMNYGLFSIAMLFQTLMQFLVGFIAGLILNIIFGTFVAFGQIVSVQIGISMASCLIHVLVVSLI